MHVEMHSTEETQISVVGGQWTTWIDITDHNDNEITLFFEDLDKAEQWSQTLLQTIQEADRNEERVSNDSTS